MPEVRLFPISLLACKFNPHRHDKTWYQKFIGTYPPLLSTITPLCNNPIDVFSWDGEIIFKKISGEVIQNPVGKRLQMVCTGKSI